MDERVVRLFAEGLNSQEKTDLLREISHDEKLKKQYIELKNLYGLLSLSGYTTENKDNINTQYGHLQNSIKRRKLYRGITTCLRYAAVFVLLVVATYKITLLINSDQDMQAVTNTLYVPGGQRICLTLQDGTIVWLNAQSTLRYPAFFSDKERRVIVEGEAYFEVAKNAKKPFVVVSQNVELEVLGTTFNIRSYPEEEYIQTSLIEGKLKVSDAKRGLFEPVILTDNDRLTVMDAELVKDTISHKDYFLWREGIYSFENEPLTDILKRLEAYYDITIIVKDPAAFQWKYTGKVRQRDGIEPILRTLQKIHKFTIEKDDGSNVITLSK